MDWDIFLSQSMFSSVLDLFYSSEILPTLFTKWQGLNAEKNIFYTPVLYARPVFRYADKDFKIHYLLLQSKAKNPTYFLDGTFNA